MLKFRLFSVLNWSCRGRAPQARCQATLAAVDAQRILVCGGRRHPETRESDFCDVHMFTFEVATLIKFV